MKRCINLDWLECYCLESCEHFPINAEYYKRLGYVVKERDYGTPQYREMFTIYENGKPFVEIRRNPYSIKKKGGIFEENACHIRLDNSVCYDERPIDRLRRFLVAHDYTYKSVSRIDIALDFNDFDDGRSVRLFVDKYMRGELSKVNQPRVSAHGSDKWIGRCINSLKWGAQSSPNTTKLYNKTQELRECGDKQYIREAWHAAGLDLTRDVWRIEFSMTSEFQTLKNRKTGELLKKSISAYDTREKLLNQFFYMYNRYFDFRNVEYKKSGDLKPKYKCEKITLLNYSAKDIPYTPTRNAVTKPMPTRTDKILIRRLEDIQFDYTIADEIRNAAGALLEYFTFHYQDVKARQSHELHKQVAEDNWLVNFMYQDIESKKAEFARKQRELELKAREEKTLRYLMNKYGIVEQNPECPF